MSIMSPEWDWIAVTCHNHVENAATAGIPPVHTCMTCHSQIWKDAPVLEPIRDSYKNGTRLEWTRVHQLPDFVYFNHSIHVNKGVGCASCHGRVDQMPLMWKEGSLQMEWCLECHRNPEKFVRPKDQVFNMAWHPAGDQVALGSQLVKEYHIETRQDCYTCHR